jgi:SAM-dependent methyltransferase
MKIRLTEDNPHGYNRLGYAWHFVPAGSPAHLDYGSNYGYFLESLKNKNISRLVGIDVSHEAVEKGHHQYPHLELHHYRNGGPLPFEDATFDSISILEVIEHLDNQTQVLDELHRVLKDDGLLIVSVPKKYFFSFCDSGNFKFVFPRLHKWCYCLFHSRAEYEYRYVSNPDGLIGDVSARKKWHEHFSESSLKNLLNSSGFNPINLDGAGFFIRPLEPILYLMVHIPGLRKLAIRFIRWDERKFGSLTLLCSANKYSNSIKRQ